MMNEFSFLVELSPTLTILTRPDFVMICVFTLSRVKGEKKICEEA